jgi:hypothetical protein
MWTPFLTLCLVITSVVSTLLALLFRTEFSPICHQRGRFPFLPRAYYAIHLFANIFFLLVQLHEGLVYLSLFGECTIVNKQTPDQPTDQCWQLADVVWARGCVLQFVVALTSALLLLLERGDVFSFMKTFTAETSCVCRLFVDDAFTAAVQDEKQSVLIKTWASGTPAVLERAYPVSDMVFSVRPGHPIRLSVMEAPAIWLAISASFGGGRLGRDLANIVDDYCELFECFYEPVADEENAEVV